MIVQLCYSETDTLKYPIKAYPGYNITDTCVLFTTKQANQALKDGINSDYLLKELDSCQNINNDMGYVIERQNSLIVNQDEQNTQYKAIIEGFTQKESIYIKDNKKLQNKLKTASIVNKIIYPALAVLIIGLTIGIFVH